MQRLTLALSKNAARVQDTTGTANQSHLVADLVLHFRKVLEIPRFEERTECRWLPGSPGTRSALSRSLHVRLTYSSSHSPCRTHTRRQLGTQGPCHTRALTVPVARSFADSAHKADRHTRALLYIAVYGMRRHALAQHCRLRDKFVEHVVTAGIARAVESSRAPQVECMRS